MTFRHGSRRGGFRAAGGGGASWSPLSLPNLVAWWDASDPATITAAGGAVSQWNDKSGNGNHVAQGTAGSEPTTGTRVINGRNALDFDGVDDGLNGSNGGLLTDVFTAIAVIVPDAVAAGTAIGTSDSVGVFPLTLAGGQAGVSRGVSFLGSTNPPTVAPGVACVLTTRYSGTDILYDVRKDGGPWGSTGAFGAIPRGVCIANGGPGINFFDGLIGEILLCSTARPDADCANAEAYLKAKWGTP